MLFTDPVRWAKSVAGTRVRFVFCCTASFLSGVATAIMAHLAAHASILRHTIGPVVAEHEYAMWASLYAIVLASSSAFPIMYLTALRRVLLELDRREGTEKGASMVSPDPH